MVNAKALSTFRMGKELIRRGELFKCEAEYLRALERNGLADSVEDNDQQKPTAPLAASTTAEVEPKAAKPKPQQGGRRKGK